MSEVYDVCQRLEAAGFPQPVDEQGRKVGTYTGGFITGPEDYCPNASECMKDAHARGYGMEAGWTSEGPYFMFYPLAHPQCVYEGQHPTDPDQAARLALAAALEAAQ